MIMIFSSVEKNGACSFVTVGCSMLSCVCIPDMDTVIKETWGGVSYLVSGIVGNLASITSQ